MGNGRGVLNCALQLLVTAGLSAGWSGGLHSLVDDDHVRKIARSAVRAYEGQLKTSHGSLVVHVDSDSDDLLGAAGKFFSSVHSLASRPAYVVHAGKLPANATPAAGSSHDVHVVVSGGADVDAVVLAARTVARYFGDSRSKLMFVLTDFAGLSRADVASLLRDCWVLHELLNSLAVSWVESRGGERTVGVHTYNPFMDGGKLVDVSRDLADDTALSTKLFDGKGYPVKFPEHDTPPFIYKVQQKGQPTRYEGLSLSVADMAVTRSNFGFVPSSERDAVPGNWVRSNSFYGEEDFYYLVTILVPDLLENASYPFYLEKLVFIVPKAQMMPKWMKALLPFSYDLWLVYLLCFPVIVVIEKAFSRVVDERQAKQFRELETFRLFYLGTYSYPPLSLSMKIYVLFVMLFNVVCLTAYTGSFTSHLSGDKYYDDIETMYDLRDRSMKIAVAVEIGGNVSHDVSQLIAGVDLSDEKAKILVDRMEMYDTLEESIYAAKVYRMVAVAYNYLGSHYEISKPENLVDNNPLLHIMDPMFFNMHIVSTYRRNFFLAERIDSILLRIKESGFMDKVINDGIRSFDLQLKNKYSTSFTTLEMEHLQTFFFLWFMGIVYSTIGLIYEFLLYLFLRARNRIQVKKLSTKRRVMNIWCSAHSEYMNRL